MTKTAKLLGRFSERFSGLLIDEYQKHLADLDLTLVQAQALRVLRRRGAASTGQLAAELRISAPALTQLTDRLARKSLIERRADEGDRRSVRLALSSKGLRLVDEFRKRRSRVFTNGLRQLDEAEQKRFVELLEKIVDALGNYEPQTTTKRSTEGTPKVKKKL